MSAAFLEALLTAAGQADARRAVESVLKTWAGERIYVPRGPLQRDGDTAADLARRLIFGGVTTRSAAEILRKRRGLSARHARRLVRACVAMRGQSMAASRARMEPMTHKEPING